MPIHILKKVPDEDHYVIGDFTTATSGGAIRGLTSSCVVVAVSCATD